MADRPLENSFKRTPFDENGPFENSFVHSDKINQTFLQENEIGKVISEQVWTK